ncbi:hypothetical protein Goshw_028819 [Gossypium schwendimanii]|uniref:Retrotransposon Copia-like N-terminal domain-containing protein n=1 Tax=Gossypium schwendimanii TaxID=34291 RepID=A0A7J9KPG6_GOSSC|nr:hypothetical protein [Gossypium schwendimanii]
MLVDESNFLAWKQHVQLVLKTHRLLLLVEGTVVVLSWLISDKDGAPVENPAYTHYEQQNSWEALTRIIGTQSTTKAMRFCSLLHHFKKNDFSISEYLAGIKHLCDLLAGCGHHVSLEKQQLAILNGLPPEFNHVVSIITTSRVLFDLYDITTALLDAEARQYNGAFSEDLDTSSTLSVMRLNSSINGPVANAGCLNSSSLLDSSCPSHSSRRSNGVFSSCSQATGSARSMSVPTTMPFVVGDAT